MFKNQTSKKTTQVDTTSLNSTSSSSASRNSSKTTESNAINDFFTTVSSLSEQHSKPPPDTYISTTVEEEQLQAHVFEALLLKLPTQTSKTIIQNWLPLQSLPLPNPFRTPTISSINTLPSQAPAPQPDGQQRQDTGSAVLETKWIHPDNDPKQRRHLPSCLNCVLANLPCSPRLPSCARCIRSGTTCLAQRYIFEDEEGWNGKVSGFVLLRSWEDDGVWREKEWMERQMLWELQRRIDARNWVCPKVERGRGRIGRIGRLERLEMEENRKRRGLGFARGGLDKERWRTIFTDDDREYMTELLEVHPV